MFVSRHHIRFTEIYLYLQQAFLSSVFLVLSLYNCSIKADEGIFGKSEWVDWCFHQGLAFYLAVYSHPCQRTQLKTDFCPARVQIGSLL